VPLSGTIAAGELWSFLSTIQNLGGWYSRSRIAISAAGKSVHVVLKNAPKCIGVLGSKRFQRIHERRPGIILTIF
jgi:hypothetical protein